MNSLKFADFIALLLLGVAVGSYLINNENQKLTKESLELNREFLNLQKEEENHENHN